MRRVQLRGGARRQPARRTCRTLSRLSRAPTKQSLSEKAGQSDEKGPAARRRPKAAGEAYFPYVEPAAEGANEAEKAGQSDEKGPAARRRPKAAGEAYFPYVEPAAEGANEADGPLSSLWAWKGP